MCGLYCIASIEYMLAGNTLLDYINFFFPNDYRNNGKIIYKQFKDKYDKKRRKPSLQQIKKKKIDKTRNYILKEKKHNELMGEKHKKCVGL